MKQNEMTKGGELEEGMLKWSRVRKQTGVSNEMITMLSLMAIMLIHVGVNGFIIERSAAIYGKRRPETGKVMRSVEAFGTSELNYGGVEIKKTKIFGVREKGESVSRAK